MMTSNKSVITQVGSLLRPHWPIVLAGMLLSLIGGGSVAGLLALVNQGLYAKPSDIAPLLSTFAALCVLIVIGSVGSDIGANYVGQRIVASLRKSLAAKILEAPIDQLEAYRTYRLIPVLTKDVDTISDFAFFTSAFLVSLVITCGCMVYLAILSWQLFLVTTGVVILGSAAHGYARSRGVSGFAEARQGEDDLQKHYRTIADGAKELRLNRRRRRHVHAEKIEATVDRIRSLQVRSINLFVTARGFGTILFFLVIGAALVSRPLLWPDQPVSVSSGFVLILLYVRGPIDQIIGVLPALGRAQVALRRIVELSEQFSSPEQNLLAASTDSEETTVMDSIELRGVSYAFRAQSGDYPFVLGPIDLRIQRGDVVFIVGENGSGKTTLIKLLLGLYEPQSGVLLRDGVAVGPETRDDYRQLFTTIFSDYYLFEDLLKSGADLPDMAARYLDRLDLAHKVTVEEGVLSTTDLSTGQRKRLALMNAWIENRPVLVFDEWAADQDPAFRHIFYTELLPDLKRLGKTIIVISHDDRYFSVADRLVRLQDGRIAPHQGNDDELRHAPAIAMRGPR
jgi:putative pyoverdin transport system ATP-binding/permease protein